MKRQPLRVVIRQAAQELEAAGVPTPQVDAEELAAWILGVGRTRLGLQPLVEPEWVEHYRTVIARRAQRIPLQHIIGEVQLGLATIQVGPGVFIPRPETELLVDWALRAVKDVSAPLVVDLCSGSGAIALAVSAARPDARVVAVERDPNALAWARRNLELHLERGGTPIDLRGGDIADERVTYDLAGQADLVLSNPPYVPDATPVEPEVSQHDPAVAVFGGADGLDVIRVLVPIAAGLLRTGGLLGIEHDDTQGASVPAILQQRRVLADVQDHTDLAGRPRFVTAQRVSLGIDHSRPF